MFDNLTGEAEDPEVAARRAAHARKVQIRPLQKDITQPGYIAAKAGVAGWFFMLFAVAAKSGTVESMV